MNPLHPTLAAFLSFGTAAVSFAQTTPKSSEFLKTYCVECHGDAKPKAGLNLTRIMAQTSVGRHADDWDKVLEMLDTAEMPPSDAKKIPTDLERTAAATAIRTTLKTYEREHAGEPGRVTVPHPKKDLPPGTVASIRRQAGLR